MGTGDFVVMRKGLAPTLHAPEGRGGRGRSRAVLVLRIRWTPMAGTPDAAGDAV